jgi:hypothetical protein
MVFHGLDDDEIRLGRANQVGQFLEEADPGRLGPDAERDGGLIGPL